MASGIGDFVSGIFGTVNAARAREGIENGSDNPWATSDDYLKQLLAQYSAIGVPDLQNATAEQTGANAFDSVQMDPQTRAYQMQALSRLGDEVNTKGLTAEDQAAQQQALQQAGRFEAGQRGAAEQRAASRGMGGAMSSQLAALQGQQSAINQANTNAVDLAGQNRQRYMQALSQLGNQAGNVRGQDWQQASARAQAQNQINQFNTGMRWQAQQHNLNVPQQAWEDKMKQTGAIGGVTGQISKNALDEWKAKYGLANDLGNSAGKAGEGEASFISNMFGGG